MCLRRLLGGWVFQSWSPMKQLDEEVPLESTKINKTQLVLGCLFLLAGTIEYLVSRPIGSAYFLAKFPALQSFFHQAPNVYGKLGVVAPEFFHALGFCLISMAFFSTRKAKISICILWFSIDSVFELAQKYGTHLAGYIPKWFESVPILENLTNYFMYGTFDIYDLVAIGLGSLTAFFLGELLARKGEDNVRKQSGQESIKGGTLAFH